MNKGKLEILGSISSAWIARKRLKVLVLHNENRDKVAKEILETEQTYVRNLEIIVQNFLKPLKNINPPLLSANSIQIIFGHVEDLLNVNRVLLNAIQDRMSTWYTTKQIGDSLLKLAPYLKVYTQYCSSYDIAINRLKRKCDDSKDLTAFLKRISSETGFGLDLTSLLIMPIQRIPRYKLLLKSLIEYTPKESPDYPVITEACEKISQVADHINESIREKQNSDKIISIQRRFTGYSPSLLASHRVFIKEGYLTKICRKEPKKRWFILFSDALLYGTKTETVSQIDPIYKFHRLLPLLNSKIVNLSDSKFKSSFQIIHSEKSFTVFADTEQEKLTWIKELELVLKKLSENEGSIPRMNKPYTNMRILKTNTKEEDTSSSGITAPIWIPDNEALECMICSIKFNTIRRRHHCRRCGNVVCGKCSDFTWRLENQKKDSRVCKTCFTTLSTTEGCIINNNTIQTKSQSTFNLLQGSSLNNSNLIHSHSNKSSNTDGISIDADSSSDNDTDPETSSITDSHTEIPIVNIDQSPPKIELTPTIITNSVVISPTPPSSTTNESPTSDQSSGTSTPPLKTSANSTFTPPALSKSGSQNNSLLSFCSLILTQNPNVAPAVIERKSSQSKLSDLAKFNMPEHGKRSNNSSPLSSPAISRKTVNSEPNQSNNNTPTITPNSSTTTLPILSISTTTSTTVDEKVVLPEIKSISPPPQTNNNINSNNSNANLNGSNLNLQKSGSSLKIQPVLPPTSTSPVVPKVLQNNTQRPISPPTIVNHIPPQNLPQPIIPTPIPSVINTSSSNLSVVKPLPVVPKKPLPPPPPPKQPSSNKIEDTLIGGETQQYNHPIIGKVELVPPPIPPKRKTMAPIYPDQSPVGSFQKTLPPTPPKRV